MSIQFIIKGLFSIAISGLFYSGLVSVGTLAPVQKVEAFGPQFNPGRHVRRRHRSIRRGHRGIHRSARHAVRHHRYYGRHYGIRFHAPYYAIGHHVSSLPHGYRRFHHGGHSYYYYGGHYYRYGPGGYVVIAAPFGYRLGALPPGYFSFYLGPRRYYYYNNTYYWWNPEYRQYVVVRKPRGADRHVAKYQSNELRAIPKRGQSRRQQGRDRKACNRVALKNSGFDPSRDGEDSDAYDDYLTSAKRCLQRRGYAVK